MDKRITMKDIAKELGISINAVSIALNNRIGVSDEMRLKVLRTANELGYIDSNSRFLRTFEHFNFCVMMQDIYTSDMDFYGKVLYSAVQESKNKGYDTLLNYFNDENMVIPNCIVKRKVSGILVIGKISNENVVTLKSFNIPIVLIDHALMSSNANCILTDNKSGGFIATQYLIKAGFDRIGFFGDLSYSQSIKERFSGFVEALVYEEIIKANQQDKYISKYSITDNLEQHVLGNDVEAIVQLLSLQKVLPQAYFCSNDHAAVILISALRKKGLRVPQDISLIGFDNVDLCEKITPKLTSVNVNKEVMGQRAVLQLLHLIEGKKEVNENIVLGVELVVRASVLIVKT